MPHNGAYPTAHDSVPANSRHPKPIEFALGLVCRTPYRPNPVATKTLHWDGCTWNIKDFDSSKLFDLQTFRANTLWDFYQLLLSHADNPRVCLFRNVVIGDRPLRSVRRLTRPRENHPATLQDIPTRLIIADIDDGDVPSDVMLKGPEAACLYIRDTLLPDEFKGASAVWQATSGHGIKPGPRVRLFFASERPVSSVQAKAWLKGIADSAPFNGATPTYIAHPRITGADDPIPVRLGWLPGTDVVCVPQYINDHLDLQSEPIRWGEIPELSGSVAEISAWMPMHLIAKLRLIGSSQFGLHRGTLLATTAIFQHFGADRIEGDNTLRDKIAGTLSAAIREQGQANGRSQQDIDERLNGLHSILDWCFEQKIGADKIVNAFPREPIERTPLPSAGQARSLLEQAVGHFFNELPKADADFSAETDDFLGIDGGYGPRPSHLVAASLGLGKTHTAIAASVARIRSLRVNENSAAAAVILTPMHLLSDQIADDIRAIAPELSVAVLRGPEAKDPDRPDERVCKIPEERQKMEALLLDGCKGCALKKACIAQTSKKVVADIYIQAHNAFAVGKAAPSIKKRQQYLDHIIVDENPTTALLFGVDKPLRLPLVALRSALLPQDAQSTNSFTLSALALRSARIKLEHSAELNGVGPMKLSSLLAVELGPDEASKASSAEWDRKIEQATDPNINQNRTIKRAAAIWKEVAQILIHHASRGVDESGRLRVGHNPETGLFLEVSGVRKVDASWNAPTLFLDATPNKEVLEAVIGKRIDRVTEVYADEPFLTIKQDTEKTGAKSMMLSSPSPKGMKAAQNNLRRVEAGIRSLCQRHETVGLITYKNAIDQLDLPANCKTGHFNALRGLNSFAQVDLLIIVGRPLPDEGSLNLMASTIYDAPINARLNLGGVVRRNIKIGEQFFLGTGKSAQHPNSKVNAVLTLIRDAEVEQAIGRLRAVNRDRPIECLLISDAIVRYAVEPAAIWSEYFQKADPIEWMLNEGGIAFTSPAQAAKAYRAKWKSRQAAEYSFNRNDRAKNVIGDLNDLFCLVAAQIRLPRAKATELVLVDATRHADPKTAVARALGKRLAEYTEIELTEYLSSEAIADENDPVQPAATPSTGLNYGFGAEGTEELQRSTTEANGSLAQEYVELSESDWWAW